MNSWHGQKGIDGIYRDPQGNYVIVESKATGKLWGDDPGGTKGNLAKPQSGRQLSDDWIRTNVLKLNNKRDQNGNKLLSDTERDAILDQLDSGKLKRVLARTDERGTRFFEVKPVNGDPKEAVVGDEFKF